MYKNSVFEYIAHIYIICVMKKCVYIACRLHRCSKAIVNIYIHTLKKSCVYIYISILQTYSSDFSGDVYIL